MVFSHGGSLAEVDVVLVGSPELNASPGENPLAITNACLLIVQERALGVATFRFPCKELQRKVSQAVCRAIPCFTHLTLYQPLVKVTALQVRE
jgi:hypothetical protein